MLKNEINKSFNDNAQGLNRNFYSFGLIGQKITDS